MDPIRKEKLINKLKKCLALSASPEPHEAAAALRHAQKLMRELQMDESDLLSLEIERTIVKTREGFGACTTMSILSNLIQDAFAVKAYFACNPGSARRLNVCYIGPRDRVLLAEYSHRVVWRAMQSSWDNYLALRPELKGASKKRQAFHYGWLSKVKAKVEAISPDDSEQKAINVWINRNVGELATKDMKASPVDSRAYNAGAAAAEDFSLHTPVNEQQQAIGKS